MSSPGRGPARYPPAATTAGGAEVAGPLERRDEHGAGAVDLDGAVAAEKGRPRRAPSSMLEGERLATEGAWVRYGVLALCHAPPRRGRASPDRSRARKRWAHIADVHHVGAIADRIAVLPPTAGELHGADPRAGTAFHRPENEHASACPVSRPGRQPRPDGTEPARPDPHRARSAAADTERRRHGLGRHRVVHDHEAGDAVDVGRRDSRRRPGHPGMPRPPGSSTSDRSHGDSAV